MDLQSSRPHLQTLLTTRNSLSHTLHSKNIEFTTPQCIRLVVQGVEIFFEKSEGQQLLEREIQNMMQS